MNVIEFSNVTFKRGEHTVFDRLDLSVEKGKLIAILGPSGTGKTTFLHLIGRLLSPQTGAIKGFDKDLSSLRHDELFEYRRRLGMLFQSGALFMEMNVFDNVAFPIRVHTRLPERIIRNIVLMKLEAVGLRGAHDLMPAELSGGMSRRVALARAIALDPEILLYDEPFTGQDPISMAVVVKLIKTLNDSLGLTSIVVSHDVQEVLSIADYAYILSEGKIIAAGTPDEIRSNTSERVEQFVHGRPDGPVRFHYPAPKIAEDLLGGS